jgi:hypothetical protein
MSVLSGLRGRPQDAPASVRFAWRLLWVQVCLWAGAGVAMTAVTTASIPVMTSVRLLHMFGEFVGAGLSAGVAVGLLLPPARRYARSAG